MPYTTLRREGELSWHYRGTGTAICRTAWHLMQSYWRPAMALGRLLWCCVVCLVGAREHETVNAVKVQRPPWRRRIAAFRASWRSRRTSLSVSIIVFGGSPLYSPYSPLIEACFCSFCTLSSVTAISNAPYCGTDLQITQQRDAHRPPQGMPARTAPPQPEGPTIPPLPHHHHLHHYAHATRRPPCAL